MIEHTPGPWFVTAVYMPYDFENDYEDKPVNWLVTNGKEWDEYSDFQLDIQIDTCEADARLIAASPELLEALETIALMDTYALDTPQNVARAAIAKARGNA